jgi:hypothetical protein
MERECSTVTVFAPARSVVIEIGPNNQVGRLGRNDASNQQKKKGCTPSSSAIQDLHGGSFFHSPCSHPSVEAYERLLLTTRAENIQLASAERILCLALQFCRSEVYLKTLA